ncbi:MAG: hypothetical protein GDA50_05980 [Alphaproteobacteria bacterium GM202ARS2]|nr:hypothetical protein [Alphaproteobacteria bacterium GM202ARS2]
MAPPIACVFAHGWAFMPTIWQQTWAMLKKEAIDCWVYHGGNYFGTDSDTFKGMMSGVWHKQEQTQGRCLIGIGHSFGLCRLLQEDTAIWDGLVSVSGVLCLVKKPDNRHGVDGCRLRAMADSLDSQPERMLRVFYARCGVSYEPAWEQMNVKVLKDDLATLSTVDCRQRWRACLASGVPLLACASVDDAIVPLSLAQAHFDGAGVDFRCWQKGGHVLPLVDVEGFVDGVLEFVRRVQGKREEP